MESPFVVGDVSRIAAYLLAAVFAAYGLATAYHTRRAFLAHLEDRWSAAVATALFVFMVVFLVREGPYVLPAPFSVGALVVAVGAVVFSLTYTASRMHERIERFQAEFGARLNAIMEKTLPEDRLEVLERIRARWREDKEGQRKLPHLMMGLFLVVYGFVGYAIVRGIWVSAYGGDPDLEGGGTGEGIANLYAASHAETGTVLVGGHIFAVWALFSLLFILAPGELIRLRHPETGYPFKAILESKLREKELALFGAHYYILLAVAASAAWLGRDSADWDTGIYAIAAVIGVTVFADTASALVGVRYGRRKLPHNPGKSYAGTVAGTLVAIAVALPFVGPLMAVATGLVFLVVDVVAPVPWGVSDNLLNPLVLSIAYTAGGGLLDPMLPFY